MKARGRETRDRLLVQGLEREREESNGAMARGEDLHLFCFETEEKVSHWKVEVTKTIKF